MKNFYRLLIVVATITITNFGVNAQNIGIGTSSPAQKLEIAGTTNTIRINGISTGGTFIVAPTANTDKILYATATGDIKAILPGSVGSILTLNASGVPTWSTVATAWQLTGNSGTTTGTNFIGTTDATDLEFKTGTGGVLRMTIGGTALDAGYIGINTAPVGGTNPQQLTVSSTAIGNTAIVGTNTAAYNVSTNGIIGVAGLATGGAINFTVNTGTTAQSVNAGVFGSAGRGNGTTTLGFGTVGLLGNSLPNSSAFPPGGAGVLGATKTGGTAPFAAGVAGFASGGGYAFYGSSTGGGYGMYNTATGGGIGYYTSVTGSSSLITGTSGNFGVYVLGNKNSVSGVYSYMGSKGVATVPTVVSAVYATTDSTLGNVWALVANNTKSTVTPTGNGLLVFGTTDEVGTVTLGQNTTTYMTGGVTANGQLVFDNASNTFTTSINANPAATGSYTLILPAAQATAAGQVLTNDGAGNLSWASSALPALSNLTNGTGISSFAYNGSAAATIGLANTAVTANSYGDANDFTTFTVNAQGQLTAAGSFPLPTTLPPSGTAGGDLTGTYPNPTINELQGIGVTASGANAPTTGQVLEYNGANWVPTTPSAGGVTSVGLALPSIFTVSGSPVTTTGTLTGTLANENANLVFAGPVSGGAGAPTFRSLVAADLPAGSGNYIQNQNSVAQTANFYITGNASIGTAPVAAQQLTVGNSTIGNTAIVGANTAIYNPSTNGISGVSGVVTGGGSAITNGTVNTGTAFSVNTGVFGSAGRGNGSTTLGFGVVGLLGTSLPNSSAFPAGAGVLGATKTGGTAPFAAGVAAFSSGGGYGVYSNVTGGGFGFYTAETGAGALTAVTGSVALGSGNIGVFVNGNSNTMAGVYSYMGSKGIVTAPTTASAIYGTTDSTTARVWAITANNTKSTTAPTGNGLLVFGTTDEVGTVTLGQNITTYMTGGVTANGQLVFDNASNAFTATINANPSATANYALTLPPAQATAAGQVLTNDGAGNLSWSSAASGRAILSNGTGISAFSYNGSSAATVGIANTGVTAGTYGSDTTVPVYDVNAQGQITSVTNVRISSGALTGIASGDLSGSYPNPTVVGLEGIGILGAPTTGQVLEYDGTNWVPSNPSGTGTVTSVGLALPSIFTVSGSPVTGAGTLTGTLANQNANLVFAGPASGGAGAPTFRALVAADLPAASGNYIQNQNSVAQTANFYINGNASIGTAPVTGQQFTVATTGTGSTTPAAVVGSNSLAVAGGSTNGSAGIVGLANGGLTTFKDSSALNMSIGVYGSSGPGTYVRNTGVGFVGVGVLGLVGGASTTFPNSQPLPSAAGVVGASNNGGVGVVGMTSKGGTGVFATTASTNGQAPPLPVSGYGVFAVGSSKSEGAVYGFIGNGEDQFPLTTAPAVNASIYGTTNLSGNNATTLLQNWAMAAINNNNTIAPTGNGLLVYGTTNEIGIVTIGQNTSTYMTGGVASNGSLVFDNASNAFTTTINANAAATASYSLILPPAQATAAGQVLTNDGAGNLTWASAGAGSLANLTNGTGISAFTYNGSSAATVGLANTGVSAGTYGSATQVPQYTVNAQGQITSTSNITITGVTPGGVAGGDLTGTYPNPTINEIQGIGVLASGANAPANGQVLEYNGANWVPATPAASGVTSVGLALPSIFTVSGSPVTTTGTLTGTFANENANLVFAGPVSGGAEAPAFRSLVAADLPAGSGNYIQNQNSVAQTANFFITGNASIGTAPVATQALTVTTNTLGNSGIVGSNTFAVAAGSGNGAVGVVGLGNGGSVVLKDSSAIYVSAGVYGSSGTGSYVRNTGIGFVGVGVVGLSGTTFPNSQPLPPGAGVVGASNAGGVGVVGMTSKGGTGVFATTASTNGQVAPLPVSGYGVFAVGSSKSENAIYGFLGSGEDQFPLTTVPEIGASIYATTNLTGVNANTALPSYALAAVNNSSLLAPTGNGLFVYGTTNEIGTVTLGQNTTTYMSGGVAANGSLVFDNASNAFTASINANPAATASYSLVLPPAQATASGQVLTNDGAGNLSWASASGGGGAILSNGTGINTLSYNGSSAAAVSIANTGVTAGTYGSDTTVPVYNVNAQGQITSVTNVRISSGALTGTAGGDLTGTYPDPTINELQGIGVLASGANAPSSGQVLEYNGVNWVPGNPSGVGTVTSVGLALPLSVFNVSGSPVTGAGTLTGTFANQNANLVFAGPVSGGAGAPTFRSLMAADLPAGSGNYVQNQNSVAQTANFYITGNASIGTAPVSNQLLTVGSSTIGNSSIAGINTATYNTINGGINGVSGVVTGGGSAISNDVVNTGGATTLSVNTGVYGSAGRGNGSTTLGFGVVGLLGTSLPTSSAFPAGAGVLGATKTGGTAPFAAGVAAYSSGGGYGLYSSVTGGGYGLYNTTTGGGYGIYSSSTGGAFGLYESVTGAATLTSVTGAVPLGSGNFGVFVNGNSNSLAGVYSYMGSKGIVTAPTTVSGIYATTDSSTSRVWALTANNTKFATPTGNGLLVFGTSNSVGALTLGQNTTTYMTGGTTANGSLVFDNASNAFTTIINANPAAVASYALTLPPAQATASGQVLTNDGAGNLSWTSAGTGSLVNLTNGTGVSAFIYNGSSVATVGLANTAVTANSYGDASNYPTFTVNAQGQLTAASTQPLPTTLPPSGAAGGDLTGNYPNPTLNEIQGIGVLASGVNAPTAGNILAFNGTQWQPTTGGSAGQVLQWSGIGVPTWVTPITSGATWQLLGNIGITTPAAPATYGTSTIASGQNWIGTTDGNDIVLGTGNVERMRIGGGTIAAPGNVGIGTATPNQPLELGTTSGTIRIDGLKTGNSYYATSALSSSNILFSNTTTGDIYSLQNGISGQIMTIVAGVPTWQTPAAATNVWQLAGNGAITTPSIPATYGTSAIGSGQSWMGTTDANDVVIGTGNVERMRIGGGTDANAGNVGIGTATPAQTLELGTTTGTIRVDGLKIGNSYYATSSNSSSNILFSNTTTGDIYSLQNGTSGQVLAINSGVPTWTDPANGTVSSIGLSVPGSSIFGVTGTPVTTSGTIGITTTGASGGIPYFSSSSVLSSSGVLTQNDIVLGGGAGNAPTPLTTANNAVLTTNSSGVPSWSTTGVLNNIQVLTSGTTYTPTAGTNLAVVELIGGGGGGGITTNPGTNVSAGAGGGAGGYIKFIIANPSSGGYVIAIGGGGASASGGNPTTFKLNGTVTYTANGGSAGTTGNANFSVGGGAGGTTSISGSGTALLSIAGNPGGNGNSSNTTGGVSGSGGPSVLGGAGASVSLSSAGGPTTGGAGAANSGSGGAGGITGGGHGVASGGAGGSGVIIITEYK